MVNKLDLNWFILDNKSTFGAPPMVRGDALSGAAERTKTERDK